MNLWHQFCYLSILRLLIISALRPLCLWSTQVSYRHELLFTCQLAALTPLMCTQAYRWSLPSTNQVQNVEFWYHYIICFPATIQDFVLVSSSMVALVMIHVLSRYYAGFWTSIAGCGRSHYIYVCFPGTMQDCAWALPSAVALIFARVLPSAVALIMYTWAVHLPYRILHEHCRVRSLSLCIHVAFQLLCRILHKHCQVQSLLLYMHVLSRYFAGFCMSIVGCGCSPYVFSSFYAGGFIPGLEGPIFSVCKSQISNFL